MSEKRRQDLVYPPGPETRREQDQEDRRLTVEVLTTAGRLFSQLYLVRHDEEAILRVLRQVPRIDRLHARIALFQALGAQYANAGRALALCERVFGSGTMYFPSERRIAESTGSPAGEAHGSAGSVAPERKPEPIVDPEAAFDEGRTQTLCELLKRLVSQDAPPPAPDILVLLDAGESYVAQAALSRLNNTPLPGEHRYGKTYYQALKQAAGEAVSDHLTGRRGMSEQMLPGRHKAGRIKRPPLLPLETRLLNHRGRLGSGQLLGSWDKSVTPEAKAQRHAEAEGALAEDHPALEVLDQGGGESLSEEVLGRVNRLFGYNFSHVRIHTDARAAQVTRLLGARALAFRAHIYFGAGQFAPGTPAGDRLLLHELVHVVQFDEGRLPAARDAGLEVSRLDDGVEREADAAPGALMAAAKWRARAEVVFGPEANAVEIGPDGPPAGVKGAALAGRLALREGSSGDATASTTLGHELAHAIQQQRGQQLGTGVAPVEREALEREADQAGQAFMLGQRFEVRGRAPAQVAFYQGAAQGGAERADQDFEDLKKRGGPRVALLAGLLAEHHSDRPYLARLVFHLKHAGMLPGLARAMGWRAVAGAIGVAQAAGVLSREEVAALQPEDARTPSGERERDAAETDPRATPMSAQGPDAKMMPGGRESSLGPDRTGAHGERADAPVEDGVRHKQGADGATLERHGDTSKISAAPPGGEKTTPAAAAVDGTDPSPGAAGDPREASPGGDTAPASERAPAPHAEPASASTLAFHAGASHSEKGDPAPHAAGPSRAHVPAPEADAPAPAHHQLAAAAQQIQGASRAEKAMLAQSTQRQRKTIEQQIAQQGVAVQAAGTAKLASLLNDIRAQRDEVKQTFTAARAALKQKVAQQKLLARADGEKALADLKRAAEAQKKAALDAAKAEADLMDAAGRRESERTSKSTTETVAAVHRAKDAAAGAYSAKDQAVREAVNAALGKAAQDITSEIQKRGGDLSRATLDSSSKVSKSIRDAGAQLAREVGSKTGDLEKSIREGTKATVEQIDKLGRDSEQQLTNLEKSAAKALEGAEKAAQSSIKAAVDGSAARLKTDGQQLLVQLEHSEATALAEFDKAAQAAIGKLREVPAGEEVTGEAVKEFVGNATQRLREARTTTDAAITQQTGQITSSLAGLAGSFTARLGEASTRVRTGIHEAMASTREAAAVPGGVEAKCKEIRDEVKKGHDKGIQQVEVEGKKQIDEAKKGWTAERTKVEGEIKGKVDQCIAKNRELAAQAPAKFAETARSAAAEAEKSWLAKAWDGIKSGFMKFIKGLGIFLLALLVVFLVVFAVLAIGALLAGAAITLALAAKALAIAMLIVGIGFLVVGLVMAVIHRFGSFWQALGNMPWWKKLLLTIGTAPYHLLISIGDVFGVSGIIEWLIGRDLTTFRKLSTEEAWERLTLGVLTLLTIGLFKRVNAKLPPVRGPRGPRVPADPTRPGDPVSPADPAQPVEPTRPVEPTQPVEPTRPVEPTQPIEPTQPVEPTRPVEPTQPVEPTRPPPDPNLPPGYDPTTRTLTELRGDLDPTPRPGETPVQSAARVLAAESEILRRAPEIIDALGDHPRRVNPRLEDPAHPSAHTTGPRGRHGADIPLRRTDAPPGQRTIEGRIFGEPPWGPAQRASMRWISDSIMVRVINEYLRANWEQIKLDLALNGEHSGGMDAGNVVGEGFVRTGTAAAPDPVYVTSSLVRIVIQFVPGPPPDFFIVTAYPAPMGVP
jgi:hypothetical protein